MSLCLTPRIAAIAQSVTGRQASLFADDLERHAAAIHAAIAGKRVLVAGGAGSIGAATIIEILARRPAALVVLDPNENNLAELVRTLRSGASPWPGDLAIQPLDYGSPLAERYLAQLPPCDLVLSFAALKHVRSERDAFSLLRLFEVNLLKADRFLGALRRHGHGQDGVFMVSTDKAANPVSMMGASKRIMEQLLWAHATPHAAGSFIDAGPAAPAAGMPAPPPLPRVTSARFANVAFSDGSLPWSFLQRIEKRQPLAAPGDIRRYLLSPREAGELCLLALTRCPHRHLVIPDLDASSDLVSFTDIAVATLQAYGFAPFWCSDPEVARAAVESEMARGRYPLLVTRSDTSGEKEIEEFVASGERALAIDLDAVQAIAAPAVDTVALGQLLGRLERLVQGRESLDKGGLVQLLAPLVPALAHRETGASLDGKM